LALTAAIAFGADDGRDYLDWAGVREAWKTTRGAGVTVATLNTGVNYELTEFQGRIQREGDGSYGFDAVTGCHDPMDRNEIGLGTQVASVIAGNQFGIAPEALLLPVRVFSENGGDYLSWLSSGVDYAVSHGAKIIQIEGGPFDLQNEGVGLCRTLQQADTEGVLIVLSPGNQGQSLEENPGSCALRNEVSVAAVDTHGDLSTYSNFGFPAVHLAAPAEDLWRIGRDGLLRKDGRGTSFSSAFAAGVAALVWSAHPNYRAADVKSALIRGSVPSETLRGKVLANGYINAERALKTEVNTAQ
jgi:subtilisin family serine protease